MKNIRFDSNIYIRNIRFDILLSTFLLFWNVDMALFCQTIPIGTMAISFRKQQKDFTYVR